MRSSLLTSTGKDDPMLFILILGFALGVYVGYAHPQHVDQAVEFTKKTVNDLKEKFGKKGDGQG